MDVREKLVELLLWAKTDTKRRTALFREDMLKT